MSHIYRTKNRLISIVICPRLEQKIHFALYYLFGNYTYSFSFREGFYSYDRRTGCRYDNGILRNLQAVESKVSKIADLIRIVICLQSLKNHVFKHIITKFMPAMSTREVRVCELRSKNSGKFNYRGYKIAVRRQISSAPQTKY